MTTKSNRHKMVDVKCEWCGIIFPARKTRVDKGQSRWCSLPHYREWLSAQGSQRKNIGKENAFILWEKIKNMYCAYWYDRDGKYHTSGWARWYWELNIGEVPKGYYASYKDGNSKNNVPENICLKTMSEISNIGERNRGVPKSEETKKKLSIAHTGKVLSEEHKANIGKATKEMWSKGVFDSPEIRAAYSRQGSATRGSKRTDEQKKKMSDTHKGKSVPWLHTPESIAKRIAKLLGRKDTDETRKKKSVAMQGRVITEEHRQNLSKTLRGKYVGKLASGYKDGHSLLIYPSEFSNSMKLQIRRRDNYTCQSCGEYLKGKRMGDVHHINNDKTHNYEENFVLLCRSCHLAVHGKKEITNEMIEYLKTQLTR